MGGGAATQVCTQTNLNLVSCGLLHPSIDADDDKNEEAYNIKYPTLWFTANLDIIVPPPTVWKHFEQDPIAPKVCGELEGVSHLYPCGTNTNVFNNKSHFHSTQNVYFFLLIIRLYKY